MRSLAPYLIIALALLGAFWIAASAFRYRFRGEETISVTGLAERDFVSDRIVWNGSFSRSGLELSSVYALLKSDEGEIRRYLNGSGIPDSSIVFSSIDVQRNYENRLDGDGNVVGTTFTGYSLRGSVTVESRNIPVVERMSREITALLEKGIELNSTPPAYYYSRLNELKIDLLAKASADARLRAETIAENSGSGLGSLRTATMGVFQITGKNTDEEYSYGGAFNTSSYEKTASITLRVEYNH